MFRKVFACLFMAIFALSLLSACAAPATPAPTQVPATKPAEATAVPAQPEKAAGITFKISGLVEKESAWKEEEVKAMKAIDVEATNKKGEKSTYKGVLISELLALAAPKADAKTLVFIAEDGFTSEAPLADVVACKDCIVSFRSNGGFSSVLPNFAGNLQVKGLVELKVK